jgi:hypothetical protein
MRALFLVILLLNYLTLLGQPIPKSYVNTSLSNTRDISKKKISILGTKVYPRIAHKTSMVENIDFVHNLSKKTGIDTSTIWKKIKMCSGNDSISHKYLIPEVFWDVKSDSVKKIINSTIKFRHPKQLTGWYIYVYFYTDKSKIKHESYTEMDEFGKVEKFFLIQ